MSLFLAGAALRAAAAEPRAIEVRATAEVREQVQTPDGQLTWRFRPAGSLRQGDEIFFTLHVRNTAPVVMPNVVVTWPVPTNTVYVRGSASGPATEISFSVDGGQTFGRGNQLRVKDEAGNERVATERDYTHIRWKLRYPLAPHAVALVRFRVIFQ